MFTPRYKSKNVYYVSICFTKLAQCLYFSENIE